MVNYALIAVEFGQGELDILHFCGFDHEPIQEDYSNLLYRLKNDPAYNLTENDKYHLIEASPKMVKYYTDLNPKDEDSYFVENGEVLKMV